MDFSSSNANPGEITEVIQVLATSTSLEDSKNLPPLNTSETGSRHQVWSCFGSFHKGLGSFLKFIGPGWLVSVALIDPGNYESDIQAGAQFQYDLLWVVWWSTVLAILFQVLSIRLGLCTGFDLAQACRNTYPRWTCILLWLLAEGTVIATDVVEVLGFAVAVRVLSGWPLYAGVLLSTVTTILLLATQRFGYRVLELIIMLLTVLMMTSFFIEWSRVQTDKIAFLKGWAIPSLHQGESLVALAMVGSVVVPQNLYLQSALVKTRQVDVQNTTKIQQAFWFNVIETSIPMIATFVLNAALISLSASSFYNNTSLNVSPGNIGLTDVCRLLKLVYPSRSQNIGCILWAISLLASGQSTAMTATYTGQIVMEGFIKLKVPLFLRSIITRMIALIPALLIVSLTGENGATMVLLVGASIPSLTLPFVLIPLIKLTSNRSWMGSFKLRKWFVWIISVISAALIIANIYLTTIAGGDDTLRQALSSLSVGAIIGIVATILIGVPYLIFCGYLVWKAVPKRQAN
eukprot:jgi/Galph1/530/GphlegSOOS_G5274.1